MIGLGLSLDCGLDILGFSRDRGFFGFLDSFGFFKDVVMLFC